MQLPDSCTARRLPGKKILASVISINHYGHHRALHRELCESVADAGTSIRTLSAEVKDRLRRSESRICGIMRWHGAAHATFRVKLFRFKRSAPFDMTQRDPEDIRGISASLCDSVYRTFSRCSRRKKDHHAQRARIGKRSECHCLTQASLRHSLCRARVITLHGSCSNLFANPVKTSRVSRRGEFDKLIAFSESRVNLLKRNYRLRVLHFGM